MILSRQKTIALFDKTILVFIIIFLLSLTNSIFINQIGYYGALLLIIIRSLISKEIPFKITGLEIPLLLFIAAEIISTVLSADSAASFNNLLKRVLLLPIIYVAAFAASDMKKVKMFVMIYLGASLISIGIYLVKSIEYFLQNLYQIEQSGPSLFQYPITASEIISFTVVFLFAFLINEKRDWKINLSILLMFLISSAALLATYKRTGWLGAAAGIFIIILIKRNWFLLLPAIAGVLLLVLIEKNKSEVHIFSIDAGKISALITVETNGRANSILAEGNTLWISDYENGLVKYSGNELKSLVQFPSPIIDLIKFCDDKYIAHLIDTRFMILTKSSSNNFFIDDEFASPGFTTSYSFANDNLYVLDRDSGLTIFTNLAERRGIKKYPSLNGFDRLTVNDSLIVLSSYNKIELFSLYNGLPFNKLTEAQTKGKINSVILNNDTLIVSEDNVLKFYKIDRNELITISEAKNFFPVHSAFFHEEKIYMCDFNGNILEVKNILKDSIDVHLVYKLNFLPSKLRVYENKLYATYIKRSRIASIFDPYIPSNYTRLALWKAGWKMFKSSPLFGVGDIDLAGLYKQYKNYYDKEIQGHLHNNFIHLLATIGLFGFAAVMYLFIKIILMFTNIYKKNKMIPFASSYSLGAIGCFVSFLVAGLTEWNFGDHEIITLVWFIVGLNIAVNRLVNSDKTDDVSVNM
jgi:O-antigen ligase